MILHGGYEINFSFLVANFLQADLSQSAATPGQYKYFEKHRCIADCRRSEIKLVKRKGGNGKTVTPELVRNLNET